MLWRRIHPSITRLCSLIRGGMIIRKGGHCKDFFFACDIIEFIVNGISFWFLYGFAIITVTEWEGLRSAGLGFKKNKIYTLSECEELYRSILWDSIFHINWKENIFFSYINIFARESWRRMWDGSFLRRRRVFLLLCMIYLRVDDGSMDRVSALVCVLNQSFFCWSQTFVSRQMP